MRADRSAVAAGLAQLEHAALARRLRVIAGYEAEGAGTRARVGGRLLRVFCSNDYLGLARHPALAAAQSGAGAMLGSGSGSAHLVTGHTRAHQQLEEQLADYCARERALLFSTGYMANLGVITAFAGRDEVVLGDRLNHASLIDGARLAGARLVRYAHGDAAAAGGALEAHADCSVIATDGLFSMDGDLAPLRELAALAARARAWLLVDDAHGLGVLGGSGRGSLELAGLDAGAVPLLVGTLGKAFGSFGAFVAGDRELIEWLLQRARTYIYTTALPPGVAAAASAALQIAAHEPWRRERLRSLTARFRAGAARLGLPLMASASPIQPLLAGDAARALRISEALFEAGFWVGAIRPPTVPPGSARLRLTLSAAHSEADVDAVLDALADLWPREGEP